MSSHSDLRIFAFTEGREFGARVADGAGVVLSELEERSFEDGEHKTRPLDAVRNDDVFVIQSLYGDARHSANDKLCRLLFLIGALKDAAAGQVTAVIPYLCYARKDRKTKARDPVTTRYIAVLLEAVGADRIVVMDVHNLAAFQNAFRCRTEHLEAKNLFVNYFAPLLVEDDVVVVSPDAGGIKRAEQFRQALMKRLGRAVGSAFMEKQRSEGVVSGESLGGDVRNKTIIVVDDMISTGGTITRTVDACRARGANKAYAMATHGIFVGEPARLLANPGLRKVAVTNSIPPFRFDATAAGDKLAVIDIAPLIAEAIKRIHWGGSLVELLDM